MNPRAPQQLAELLAANATPTPEAVADRFGGLGQVDDGAALAQALGLLGFDALRSARSAAQRQTLVAQLTRKQIAGPAAQACVEVWHAALAGEVEEEPKAGDDPFATLFSATATRAY